jgi:hypothetical protein
MNVSPINAKPLASTTTAPLSLELSKLLGTGLSADDALAAATNSPALIDEARAALPSLHRQVEGAGDAVVRDVIGRRFETYPQPTRLPEQWAAWFADYYDALSDQPAAAIEAGMRQWVRTDTTGFMPKPGQLLALVKTAAEPQWQALSRANRIAKLEPAVFVSAETLEERRRAVAEVLAGLKPASAFSESTETDNTNGPNP